MDSLKRRLEYKAEIFDEQSEICKLRIALYSFHVRKQKIDQPTSVVLSKVVKRDI